MSEATPQSAFTPPRPVIAITSQVAGNPVGGALTSAVLFNAGFRPVLVPTVVMGRHPGRGAPGGSALTGRELSSALDAILAEGLVEQAAAIFTGYVARREQVEAIASFLTEARRRRPELPVWVDPILGDGPGAPEDGRLYIRPDTAAAVRDHLVPAADVITPNLFELAWLSGRRIKDEAAAAEAARALASAALVTSAPAGEGRVGVLAVSQEEAQAVDTARIDGAPNGAGDLFAALALCDALNGAGLSRAAATAAGTVGAVFRASAAAGSAELILTPALLNAPNPRPRLRRPGATRPAWALGVDGCPGGWIGVYADMNGIEPPGHQVFADFQAVLDFGAQITAVDMPIGFLDAPDGTGMRACERGARALLGPRRSSVFPSPLRPALYADSYEAANAANRAAGGKGLSKQSFNIMAKMAEIDALMSPDMEGFVFETHPESSFAAITGAPAVHAKKTSAGRAERLAVLTANGLDESLFQPHPYARKTAAPDDLVDAGLCLLTALRIADGTALTLPADPPRDGEGLRMAIFA
jgi:pyridoxal kinase